MSLLIAHTNVNVPHGRREINFSDIGGDLASGAIAYYPYEKQSLAVSETAAQLTAMGARYGDDSRYRQS